MLAPPEIPPTTSSEFRRDKAAQGPSEPDCLCGRPPYVPIVLTLSAHVSFRHGRIYRAPSNILASQIPIRVPDRPLISLRSFLASSPLPPCLRSSFPLSSSLCLSLPFLSSSSFSSSSASSVLLVAAHHVHRARYAVLHRPLHHSHDHTRRDAFSHSTLFGRAARRVLARLTDMPSILSPVPIP